MTTARRSHDVRNLLALGCAALVLGVAAGLAYGFSAVQWLTLAMGTGVVIWVGGAVFGQVVIARLLDVGTRQQLTDFTTTLLRIIPVMLVPSGAVALGSGIALVAITGTAVLTPTVLIPIALFALTTVMGITVSAPGYSRLLRIAAERGSDDPEVQRRLMPLAWLNRVELTLVIALGFTSVVSALAP